jgi:PAS domain S-box-containing protein
VIAVIGADEQRTPPPAPPRRAATRAPSLIAPLLLLPAGFVTADEPLGAGLGQVDSVRVTLLVALFVLALITLAGVAIVHRSLRRRDEAEELVRGSEAFLDSVVENLPNMVFVKDAETLRFVRFNRAGEVLIGRRREEMLGKNDFDLFPEEQARAFTEKDQAVLEAGVLVDIPIEPIQTSHGERLLHTRKIPLVDESGVPQFLLGISDDVTEREEAKRSLERARDDADRANRAKSEFLSRMSHELRTPLNSVLGFSQILALDELTTDQAENVELIRRAGRHLLALIDEVLEISQIEAGELRFSLEPVHVKDVVGTALQLVQPAAAQADVSVPRAAHTCDHWINADRQRLLQVLLNLLSNAIKYNRPGGTVRLTCERSAGTVSLSVTDSGIGISPSNLAKLFTPFERLGAEHTPIEGTGVGLALSRLLSQQMGGSLTVSSEVGAGTTFTLELPALEAPTHEPHRERESTETAKASRTRPDARVRVLAIEDNVANLRVIERAMATLGGVDLITAVQGSLGMELAQQHQPDLILLDLHLPDIPGNEVFNRLCADPVTGSIPVVISSADATPGEAGRLLDAGAAAYLTKPIDLLQLFAVVEQVRNGERIEPATLGFDEHAEARRR